MIILRNLTFQRIALLHIKVLCIEHGDRRTVTSRILRRLQYPVQILPALLLICLLRIFSECTDELHQMVAFFGVVGTDRTFYSSRTPKCLLHIFTHGRLITVPLPCIPRIMTALTDCVRRSIAPTLTVSVSCIPSNKSTFRTEFVVILPELVFCDNLLILRCLRCICRESCLLCP